MLILQLDYYFNQSLKLANNWWIQSLRLVNQIIKQFLIYKRQNLNFFSIFFVKNQIYQCNNYERAIFISKSGFGFGGQVLLSKQVENFDLYICNMGNINDDSYTAFPNSYNLSKKKHISKKKKKDQKQKKLLIDGIQKKFKILEYEVYDTIFQNRQRIQDKSQQNQIIN